MNYTHQAAALPLLDIVGSKKKFPVRNIYCVGRNYREHVRELGGNPEADAPVFFTKQNADLLILNDDNNEASILKIPSLTNDFQPEIELVLAIGEDKKTFARAIGLDMTRRDIQAQLKAKSLPWDMSKVFHHSAICGRLTKGDFDYNKAIIKLMVNDEIRQESSLAKMIYNEVEIIKYLDDYVGLKAGDIIYTGTPAGVAPIIEHDHLCGKITGLSDINIKITKGNK